MTINKLKGLTAVVVLGLASFLSPAKAQGIPVYDNANLVQQLQQISHMVTQIENLRAQLDQAKQQYEALTGGRGMENLVRDVNYNSIPTSWQETLAMMEGGGQISDLARSIKDDARKIDTALLDRLSADVREVHEAKFNSASNTLAAAGTAYDTASERFERLQGLMDAIPQATDLKAIADLQARIQVEQVMLQNEAIKMQAFAQAAAAQERIEEHQSAELSLDRPTGRQQLRSVVRRASQ